MRTCAIASVVSSLAAAACSVVGVRAGTEEPRYDVIGHVGAIEIRRYGPRVAAETRVDGTAMVAQSIGFRRLAGYIFGGNGGRTSIAMAAPVTLASGAGERIAMAAPVGQSADGAGAWLIRFYLPADVTAASAPVPDDAYVRVLVAPPETVAVLRYAGSIAPEAVAEAQSRLLQGLAGGAWRPTGQAMTWFYDPPWTLPPLRRNEAVVAVTS